MNNIHFVIDIKNCKRIMHKSTCKIQEFILKNLMDQKI